MFCWYCKKQKSLLRTLVGGWDERLTHNGSYKSPIHLYDLHLTCSPVSPPIADQLQLHANKQSILQRRKGGEANWSDCNSVHQVQSESIMLRNGFWESECPPWVRGVCLQQWRPAFVCQRVCVLQQVVKNHNTLCFISDKSSCKTQHGAIQKMPRSFVIGTLVGSCGFSIHCWFAFSSSCSGIWLSKQIGVLSIYIMRISGFQQCSYALCTPALFSTCMQSTWNILWH